jgi:hypothetical protein
MFILRVGLPSVSDYDLAGRGGVHYSHLRFLEMGYDYQMLRAAAILGSVAFAAVAPANGSSTQGTIQTISEALGVLIKESGCATPGNRNSFLGDRNSWRFVEEIGQSGGSQIVYIYESSSNFRSIDPLQIETNGNLLMLRCLAKRPNCFSFSKTFPNNAEGRTINSQAAPSAADVNEQMYSFCSPKVADRLAEAVGRLTVQNGPSKAETIRFLNQNVAGVSPGIEYLLETTGLGFRHGTTAFFISGRVDRPTTEVYIRQKKVRTKTGDITESLEFDYRFFLEDISIGRFLRPEWRTSSGESAALIKLQCRVGACFRAGPVCMTLKHGNCQPSRSSMELFFSDYEHLDLTYKRMRHLIYLVTAPR